MIELDPVEIRQPLVPVIWIPLHYPEFVLDTANAAKRAGAGVGDHLPQIVVVIFQRLFANDDIPAAGERRHHEADRARLRQLEFDGVFVARVDLANRLEQDAARNADPGGGLGDAIVGGLHVLRGQLGAVVELHALAQMERVRPAIRGNLPAMRQIRDNRLGAIVGMPWRSTPPDLALGSGALSLNAEPSNFSGTGAAM